MAAIGLSGGEKLEARLKELAMKVSRPATLRVGFLEGATYPAGSAAKIRAAYKRRKAKGIMGPMKGAKGGTLVAMVAAIDEFGAPSRNQPPRPFFRRMIRAKSAGWGPGIGMQLKAQNYNADKVLRLTGEVIAGQLRQSINDLQSPALKESTIARKGFSKPLIDTAHMVGSVDYDVKT